MSCFQTQPCSRSWIPKPTRALQEHQHPYKNTPLFQSSHFTLHPALEMKGVPGEDVVSAQSLPPQAHQETQFLPTQFLPSGVISKPALQIHWKLPSVLTQRPFLHITPFMMHSSMSGREIRVRKRQQVE